MLYLVEAKIDDFAKRYLNYHKDEPVVQNNPEHAEKLIRHAHKFAQGHDEAIYLTKELLNGSYRPEEDDATIQSVLGKWRKAKTQGLVGGKLSDHTHESISAVFRDIPQLNMQKRQSQALQGMEKYKIGSIEHPEHGNLSVYNIRQKDIKDDKEYENASSILRKTCSGSSWCVLPQGHGPTHLKHYSHGHGIFFYVNQNGQPVLSHGFGDRGIVRPDNSVVDEHEAEDIKKKTSSLLTGDKKEAYDFFTGKTPDMSPEKQMKMYQEFGKEHAIAHFLDPKMNTHPHLLKRIINDTGNASQRAYGQIADALVKHPNFNDEHIQHIINQYELVRERLKQKNAVYNTEPRRLFDPDNDKLRVYSDMASTAVASPRISKATLSRALDIPNENIRGTAIRNPKMDDELYFKVFDMDHFSNGRLHVTAAMHGYEKFSKQTFDKAFDVAIKHDNGDVMHQLAKSKHLTPAHVEKLLDLTDTDKIKKQINSNYPEENKSPSAIINRHYEQDKAATRARNIFPALQYIMKNSKNVSDENLHAAISHELKLGLIEPHLTLAISALDNPNIKDEHLEAAMRIYGNTGIGKMAKKMHPSYDSKDLQDNLDKARNSGSSQPGLLPYAKNKHLSDNDFDSLVKHVAHTRSGPYSVNGPDRTFIGTALLENPRIKSHHIADLASIQAPANVRRIAMMHPKLSSDHIHRLISDFDASYTAENNKETRTELQDENKARNLSQMQLWVSYLAENPTLKSQHLSHMLKSKNIPDSALAKASSNLIKNKSITPENIDEIIKLPPAKKLGMIGDDEMPNHWVHNESGALVNVVTNHDVPLLPRHIEALKNHRNPQVRKFAEIRSPDLSSERMHDILATTDDVTAGMTTIMHPNRKPEHLESAMKNPHENIRKFAQIFQSENKPVVKESLKASILKVLIS